MAIRPPDSPPLLDPGRHPMTMEEIHAMCVEAFPLSSKRKAIFEEVTELLHLIQEAKFAGELWLDGSFLTTKIDPKDVDVLLFMPPIDNALTVAQGDLLHFIKENAGKPLVDAYYTWTFPHGHPLHRHGREDEAYWLRQYGRSRQNEKKGIAVIDLGAT